MREDRAQPTDERRIQDFESDAAEIRGLIGASESGNDPAGRYSLERVIAKGEMARQYLKSGRVPQPGEASMYSKDLMRIA